MALDPSAADTLAVAGRMAVMVGAGDAGLELCEKAVALDPVGVMPRGYLASAYRSLERFDEAEAQWRAILELSPDAIGVRSFLGEALLQKGQATLALAMILKESAGYYRLNGLSIVYHAVGQKEASDLALRELIEKYADNAAYQVAEVYAYRGEKDNAFEWFDRAYRQRDSGMTNFGDDALLANIRNDPRYTAMLRKLKLPEVRRN